MGETEGDGERDLGFQVRLAKDTHKETFKILASNLTPSGLPGSFLQGNGNSCASPLLAADPCQPV
ncbi:hypothetical protein P7K49_031926 [Saguinus oedipus]|uniref:Uncharacterized protein n=1 Tax=Saguinus oedipus TaxID=9490 RepID=A0ABQ9U1K0_SAGOE|nr:hypothetical protein P7K49_031926 [Saguinus oedipus]